MVYIDILFILDFIIDYLILYAVAKISGAPIFRLRLTISAALGAGFSILSLFCNVFASLPIMLGAAYLMVGISFGFRRLKHLLIFFGVSAAFGGMVFAVNYITDKNLTISLKTLVISSVTSYLIMLFAFRKSATGATKKEYIQVQIEHCDEVVSLTALVDSGNSLVDGMTNTPVLIAELHALRKLLKKEDYKMLAELPVEEIVINSEGRYRPIPYKTVGGSGLLPAFCPEKVLCNDKERRLLVAVSKDKIGENCSGIIGIEEE